jgi:arylsulfatase A-like enzyme
MLLSGRSLFRIPNPGAKTYDGPTLGGVFRKAGYATLHAGKRGNSFLAGMEAFEKVVYSHGVKGQGASQEDQARFVADEAIRFIREQKDDKPFLIYLAPHCPHDPRVAPKQFMDLYDPARLSLPKNFMPRHPFDNGELEVRDEKLAPIPRTEADMKRHLADYYGSISCLDHHVGRILDTLAATGQARNTVVVYTSDQGLAVGGRHGLMGKQNLYEHFKSPLIVAGPGVPHGQSQALVYLFDLFPTVCDLTGVATPKELEGASLVPVIRGTKPRVRDWLFAAYRDCQRMVRDERWKLIWYPKINRYQLFDLANDPWEIDDLSARPEQAERLGQMKKRLAEQQKLWGDDRAPAAK